MTNEEAVKLMAEKVQTLSQIFQECVKLADETGVVFELPYGGEGTSESGIGGFYEPKEGHSWHDTGWNPSSHSC